MRIAFFSPPLGSHLAALAALAAALRARGHACFLIHHPDVQAVMAGTALTLLPIDAAACAWSPARFTANLKRPSLPFGIGRVLSDMTAMSVSLCRQGPALLSHHGIDAVVTDQMESAGAIVARHLDLPYVSVATALPLNREPAIPLAVLGFDFDDSPAGLSRNKVGAGIADWLTRRFERALAEEARRLGVTPGRTQADYVSPLAEIAQLVPGFDFPRSDLPAHFHAIGTLRPPVDARPANALPSIPAGRPFIFASLGTLQGHRLSLFRRIAKAARATGAQLLVAHCGGLSPHQAAGIDADWVVDRTDQRAAIARADVVVTHCGLNTALDALEAGKPMLCLPLGLDQPGVAARIRRLGAGIALPSYAGSGRIARALHRLLDEQAFRDAAGSLKSQFAAAGGAARAAGIVEAAFSGSTPATRPLRSAAA